MNAGSFAVNAGRRGWIVAINAGSNSRGVLVNTVSNAGCIVSDGLWLSLSLHVHDACLGDKNENPRGGCLPLDDPGSASSGDLATARYNAGHQPKASHKQCVRFWFGNGRYEQEAIIPIRDRIM